jgi:hypothetical protein
MDSTSWGGARDLRAGRLRFDWAAFPIGIVVVVVVVVVAAAAVAAAAVGVAVGTGREDAAELNPLARLQIFK